MANVSLRVVQNYDSDSPLVLPFPHSSNRDNLIDRGIAALLAVLGRTETLSRERNSIEPSFCESCSQSLDSCVESTDKKRKCTKDAEKFSPDSGYLSYFVRRGEALARFHFPVPKRKFTTEKSVNAENIRPFRIRAIKSGLLMSPRVLISPGREAGRNEGETGRPL